MGRLPRVIHDAQHASRVTSDTPARPKGSVRWWRCQHQMREPTPVSRDTAKWRAGLRPGSGRRSAQQLKAAVLEVRRIRAQIEAR
jgi:hypothetical protein